MKKKTTLFMAVIMLLVAYSVPASAVAVGIDTVTTTETTEISVEVDPSLESYTVTIPANISIDPATGKGKCEISATVENYVWSHYLNVSMSPTNADENGIYLVNTENSDLKIAYKITSSLGQEQTTGPCDMLTISLDFNFPNPGHPNPNGTEYLSGTGTYDIELRDAYPGAGTYTDTWTFTIIMGQIVEK